MATKGYFWIIFRIFLNSASKLCAHTSTIPHSASVELTEGAENCEELEGGTEWDEDFEVELGALVAPDWTATIYSTIRSIY